MSEIDMYWPGFDPPDPPEDDYCCCNDVFNPAECRGCEEYEICKYVTEEMEAEE